MKKQTYDLGKRPLIKKSKLLNDILEETEIAVECSVSDICFSFDVGRSSFNVTRERLSSIQRRIAVGPRGSSQDQSSINNLVIDRLARLVNMTVQQSGVFHDFVVGFLERRILDPSCIISFRYIEL